MRKALDTLPARQRMVLILKYYEGLRYDEIVRAMGTTVKAVERLLGRAGCALKPSLFYLREKQKRPGSFLAPFVSHYKKP